MVIILFRETKAVPTRWHSGNTSDSYSGGPELKFRRRQIILHNYRNTQPCCRAYTHKIPKARMTIDVKCFSKTLIKTAPWLKQKNVLSNLEWVFLYLFSLKWQMSIWIYTLTLQPPFHPFRVWVLKKSFLVVTYIVIGIYTPNFMFLAPVVSALHWYVIQSVSLSYNIYIYIYIYIYITIPCRTNADICFSTL